MAQPDLNQLTTQLLETNDVRRQKSLIRQIAKLEDPRAISPLVSLYSRADVDPGVKKEAAEALKVFRRLEAQIQGQVASPATPPPDAAVGASPSPLNNSLLTRLRMILAGVLVLSLVGNGIVFAVKSTSGGPDSPIAGPENPTPRNDLTEQVRQRLTLIRADAAIMRKGWQEVQASVPLITCEQNKNFSTVAPVRPFEIDAKIYPDWLNLNTTVNEATRLLLPIREAWVRVCQDPRNRGHVSSVTGGGGGAGRIIETDNVLRAANEAEKITLEKWINAPQPTYYPSPTPTPIPPTETPVPSTSTPITPTLTLAPPTNTPIPPTLSPGQIGTATAQAKLPTNTAIPPTRPPEQTPPTATPLPGLKLAAIQLAGMTGYTYTVRTTYKQLAGVNRFDGELAVRASRENALGVRSTLQMRIDSDDKGNVFTPRNALLKTGLVDYYLRDGNYAVSVARPAPASCTVRGATAANATLLDAAQTVIFDIPDLDLKPGPERRAILGVVTSHFTGEITGWDASNPRLKAKVDVFWDSTRNVPVKIVIESLPFTQSTPSPASVRVLIGYTYEFDLLFINPDLPSLVNIPTTCRR
jgi:hypothetical protein